MWKYNQTSNIYSPELYHTADELYHYGIKGMKWKNHKYADYGSVGANLSGRIRNSLMRSTNKRMKTDSKTLNKMSKNYEWMKKNHENLKNTGGKFINSKLMSGIRVHRMNQVKKKMSMLKDSIKDDNSIMKDLNRLEKNALSKASAKKDMDKAKKAYKIANKQYSKDFNKSSTLLGAWGPGNKERHHKAYESAVAANKAEAVYKKAKAKYKKY